MNISRVLTTAIASLLLASPAAGMTKCKMTYDLKGWSFFYKTYEGRAFVKCRNGQRAKVRIVARGGGLTLGKSEIDNGKGIFTEVKDISEIFGTYVAVDGHAGATKAVEAWAMSKGEVSLALSGKGRGFDLGVALGTFTIER
jgi:hypothetical protein